MSGSSAWLLSVHEQGNHGLATFGDQNIIGATGGTGIHDFDANTRIDQRCDQRRVWKTLAITSTQQRNVGSKSEHGLEMSGGQCIERTVAPVRIDAVRTDQKAWLIVALLVDKDMVVTEGGKQVQSFGLVQVKFQDALQLQRMCRVE